MTALGRLGIAPERTHRGKEQTHMKTAVERITADYEDSGLRRRTDGMPDALEITVSQTATALCGPDSVYRYDLPLSGVSNGWAIPAIVEQARQLYPDSWPEIEVIVDAPERETEALVRAFIAKGAAAYPSEAVREEELPEPDDPGVPGRFDTKKRAAGGVSRFLPGGLGGLHLVLAGVVVLVAGVSWWAILATTSPDLRARGVAVSGAAQAEPAAEPTGAQPLGQNISDGAPPDRAPREAEPTGRIIVHELGSVRLATPPGYRVTAEDGQWLVVGPDPDLRIRVIAEPTNGVGAERVLAALGRGIEEDPQLEALEVHGAGEVGYLESPGDGSQTRWSSWVDGDQLFSLGCQTRHSAGPTQLAACDLVRDSLEITVS